MCETISYLTLKRLDSCFIVKNDKTKQIKSSFYQKTGSIPIIDQSINFICGYTDDQSKKIESNLPLIVFGDHTRHVKYVNFGFAMGADGTQILKANDDIHDKYLYYVILRASELIGNYGYDRHFKHLKEFKTPLIISYEEQKKIASILENIDNNIDKTQEIIEKYEMMKQGLMYDLIIKNSTDFTDLGNLMSFEYGQNLPEQKRSNYGYPVYGSNGIVGYHHSYLKDKGIIVGRKGTIGQVSFSNIPFWPIDTTYYIEFKKEMNIYYAFYLLSLLNLNKLDSSTGIPGLNRNDAYELSVVNKPLDEQIEISKKLLITDKKIQSEHRYLNKLQNIKTGLMQDLLTGKVRVKT